MKTAVFKTIRLGGTRGVWFGDAMGVSGLRLASQQDLCVQSCHPSPSSAFLKGAGSVRTSGRWVRGTRYRGRMGASLGLMEVTVWSALHVPRDVSGVTHLLRCSRPMLDGRCPELGYRRKVVSSHQDTMETSTSGQGLMSRPLVSLVGGAG